MSGGRLPGDLPVEPLVREVARRTAAGNEVFGRHHDSLYRAYLRAVALRRITWQLADRIACQVLTVHPFTVWGEVWWAPGADEPIGLWPVDDDVDVDEPIQLWPVGDVERASRRRLAGWQQRQAAAR